MHNVLGQITTETNHQQMRKEGFIINRNTLLHVSTLLGHLQGELFCYRYTKVALYSWVRMCCWLCTALFLEAWTLCGPGLQAGTTESRRVLQLMIKLSLCICRWLVCLYTAQCLALILYSLCFFNSIRVMKRTMRWAGFVARMGKRRGACSVLVG
jgi:hypothetical protein